MRKGVMTRFYFSRGKLTSGSLEDTSPTEQCFPKDGIDHVRMINIYFAFLPFLLSPPVGKADRVNDEMQSYKRAFTLKNENGNMHANLTEWLI